MINNLAENVPNVMRLVTACAYVMGMFFIISAIIGMKHFGESRTMMSSEHGMKGPLINLFVGLCLLYLPSSVWVTLDTFWQDPSPYSYVVATTDQWSQMLNNCYLIMQLIGTIAFVRGLVLLNGLAGQSSSHQGVLGKALAHIVGGILCINISGTVSVLQSTLGMS